MESKKPSARLNVLHALSKEIADVIVVQRIKGDLSFLAVLHKALPAKESQLVRDSRAGKAQEAGKVEYAEFLSGQGGDDPNAGGVAQCAEGFRKSPDHPVSRHGGSGRAHACGVDEIRLFGLCDAGFPCLLDQNWRPLE
jgi:hypothetical protein